MPLVKPTDLYVDVQVALKTWYDPSPVRNRLDTFAMVQEQLRTKPLTLHRAINALLLEGLEQLSHESPASGQLLRERFLDLKTVYTVAQRLNVGESTLYKWQNDAIHALTDIVWQRELHHIDALQRKVDKRMGPPPYIELFGIEKVLGELTSTLLSPNAPWIVALEGIGVLGKPHSRMPV